MRGTYLITWQWICQTTYLSVNIFYFEIRFLLASSTRDLFSSGTLVFRLDRNVTVYKKSEKVADLHTGEKVNSSHLNLHHSGSCSRGSCAAGCWIGVRSVAADYSAADIGTGSPVHRPAVYTECTLHTLQGQLDMADIRPILD